MDLINLPFTQLSPGDTPRPWLPVIIINPHSGKQMHVLGLIDTGADECALPAAYADILGHNLQAGKPSIPATASQRRIRIPARSKYLILPSKKH